MKSDRLDPVQKAIYEKYKNTGLKAYHLIDGKRSCKEIFGKINKNMTQEEFSKLMLFMEHIGVIKLDYRRR